MSLGLRVGGICSDKTTQESGSRRESSVSQSLLSRLLMEQLFKVVAERLLSTGAVGLVSLFLGGAHNISKRQ